MNGAVEGGWGRLRAVEGAWRCFLVNNQQIWYRLLTTTNQKFWCAGLTCQRQPASWNQISPIKPYQKVIARTLSRTTGHLIRFNKGPHFFPACNVQISVCLIKVYLLEVVFDYKFLSKKDARPPRRESLRGLPSQAKRAPRPSPSICLIEP